MDILMLSGSLRRESRNSAVMTTAVEVLPAGVRATLFGRLDQLPYFNPDEEESQLPAAAARLRSMVADAAGVVICCPEYAHGATGIMKNALEWLVGGVELPGKPVLLMSASSSPHGGQRAQAWLNETLEVMGADVLTERVVIPGAANKIQDGRVTAEAVRDEIRAALNSLISSCENKATEVG